MDKFIDLSLSAIIIMFACLGILLFLAANGIVSIVSLFIEDEEK